ncbi:sulfite reductase [NADPH] flavoprotein, alpha-component [Segniliparus rugosus ATCC BAA-974]|uniref:assimilatory sulfite reductase (NADPH) n=1 Tax=Segniliparus rugosus (strain ATCC BAA-974 / DSM 45345 / CCUG 50838 / CIP 108380 / JCM 13579 / CDC 945) TaxID=679197 RepID=E5XSB5_SEGRC|nr:sulfite reductase [NADPH] flavoprotein, alpha-component [Segniliparus rugosus ATCC BAA-974]
MGCGIVVETNEVDGLPVIAKVSGDKEHPTNFGRLCTKGQTHADMMRGDGRMASAYLRPERGGEALPVAVEAAVKEAGARLKKILDEHGPDAISLYVSGQMSIEAQYLANKLAKGYLRTSHIESNSRLCMASAGTGYKQSLGADGPPGSYQDFDQTDLFFVIGSNMADCHPILFLRMADRLKAGAKLIVVDPRRTATAERADLYLQIRPGTDVALLNGLLHVLVAGGHVDREFIAEHTQGWEGMEDFLLDYPPDKVAEITGLAEADIRRAAAMIAAAGEWMTCWTMGLNQSTHGVWSTNAICNLHLATGAICRPGSGPFSLTGQPNAMGGREMGYMGPGLPGQRSVVNPQDREYVERAWGLEPGTIRAAVGPGTVELFRQLQTGQIKACWIICTNPVATVANRQSVIDGLEAAELVIAQDAFFDTATNKYADVLLPAALWAESDGVMINSERNLTLLQQSVPPAGDALPDWKLICLVAAELGFGEAFAHQSSEDVFDELRAFWNPLTGWDLRGASYERLRRTPLQWPCPPEEQDQADRHPIRYLNDGVSQRPHVREDGSVPRLAFPTPSRRAAFLPRPHLEANELPDDEFPLVLNTGRLQHQWHTMTKTGKVAKLNKLNPGPFLEVHPADAKQFGVEEGQEVRVRSRRGSVVLPAVITDRTREGSCFAPFHWNDAHGENLTVNAVTSDAVDPESLQPELKVCAVSLEPIPKSEEVPALPSAPMSSLPLAPAPAGPSGPVSGLPFQLVPAPQLTEAESLYVSGFLAGIGLGQPGVPALPISAPVREPVRLWLDGMLAGMHSRAASERAPSAEEPQTTAPVLVVWASQTGNAEEFAERCVSALVEAGLPARGANMDELDLAELAQTPQVLVVTSTFGVGGPPDNGSDFWARLDSDAELRLADLKYAVFGVGDRAYDDFCGHAKALDARLAELGAARVLPLVVSESDEDQLAEGWLRDVVAALRGTKEASGPRPASVVVSEPAPVQVETAEERAEAPAGKRRIAVPMCLNRVISGANSTKEVRQFGFDISGHDLAYEAGDALGIYPANAPEDVAAWLRATGLDGTRTIAVDDASQLLADALATQYDICKITPQLLRFVAARNNDQALAKLLRRDNKVELDNWLFGRQGADLMREFPVQADFAEWQQVLPRLAPRQYSISSSPRANPDEVQLTVSVVRFPGVDGRTRGGVCSSFLADRAEDRLIPVFLQSSPHFRVPADPEAPAIMIGPGTGVAPFRGFLHERRELGHTGQNWLFFGDQHAAENFYYQAELEEMFSDGFLTRLDLAFSRDQRQRVYVQDRMVEHGARLWQWIQDGARIYVCGDASRMAKDVDETLLRIVQTHGRMSQDEAKAYKKRLAGEKRYVRDVY